MDHYKYFALKVPSIHTVRKKYEVISKLRFN